jgi:hypothetical protein
MIPTLTGEGSDEHGVTPDIAHSEFDERVVERGMPILGETESRRSDDQRQQRQREQSAGLHRDSVPSDRVGQSCTPWEPGPRRPVVDLGGLR